MTSDKALQRALDQLDIRNAIVRIAMLTDGGQPDEYAMMFSEDARLEMRSEPGQPPLVPPSVGRAAILAGSRKRCADGMTGPNSGMVHAIQEGMVSVAGDTAKAKTYAVIYMNARAKPEIAAIKAYNDTFVRTSEGWKLAERFIDPV